MKDRTTTLGKELQVLRRQQHLSLTQLADMTGRNRGYLSQIELGSRRPSTKLLEEIAGVLDVNRNRLLRHINLLKMEFTRPSVYEMGHNALDGLDPQEVEKVLDFIDYLRYLRELGPLKGDMPVGASRASPGDS